MSKATPNGDHDAANSAQRAVDAAANRLRAMQHDIEQSNANRDEAFRRWSQEESAKSHDALRLAREQLRDATNAIAAEARRSIAEVSPVNAFLSAQVPEQIQRFYKALIRPIFSWIFFLGAPILTVMAILSFYYAISPKLDPAIGDTYSKDDPFATAFSIKNDGVLPLYHVRVTCRVLVAQSANLEVGHEASSDDPKPMYTEVFAPSARITNGNYQKGSNFCPYGLPKDQALEQIAGPTYKSISLEIVVEYKEFFLRWCHSQQFFYETEQTSDGHLVWAQEGIVPDPFASAIAAAEHARKTVPGFPAMDGPPCSNY